MSPGYALYNAVISLAAPLVLGAAAYKGRLKGNWSERLGYYSEMTGSGSPRIWVHAVSVGEAQVAAALIRSIKKLKPEALVWQTSTTDTGRESARKNLPPECPVFTFPLDAYGGPGRALDKLNPDLVIILETELWPNFLRAARKRGVKTMLANGRISVRSVKGYRKVRFLFKEVLSYLDRLAMIRPDDAKRIISLGADPNRISTVGNAKYDLLLDRADSGKVDELRAELGLSQDASVIVAGSTREGEEKKILESFSALRSDFPELKLILAPRHVKRSGEIESLCRSAGFSVSRRSAVGSFKGDADILLVDVMGELFYLYALGSVAFCGGSLVPLGGQNPLEPAVWGRPVLYGPSMEDFSDAVEILENAGAGQAVQDAQELTNQLRDLLNYKDNADRIGTAGREALRQHQGASERLAALALNLLEN